MAKTENVMRKISLAFTAGVVGGLANSAVVWLLGYVGLPQLLGAQLAPAYSPAWLYPRLVWGGLWGLLFIVSTPQRWSLTFRGLVFSLGPSLAMLLYFFPFRLEKGWLGLSLGLATPVLVLLYNAVWGLAAGWWLEACNYLELMRDRLNVKAVKI